VPTCETSSLLARYGTCCESGLSCLCSVHCLMSQSEGSGWIRCRRTITTCLHFRIPTRVIPPSKCPVRRSLGDPKLFPSSFHFSIDIGSRRRYDNLLVYPSDQLFPFVFVFVKPLSPSTHTIGFFASLSVIPVVARCIAASYPHLPHCPLPSITYIRRPPHSAYPIVFEMERPRYHYAF